MLEDKHAVRIFSEDGKELAVAADFQHNKNYYSMQETGKGMVQSVVAALQLA